MADGLRALGLIPEIIVRCLRLLVPVAVEHGSTLLTAVLVRHPLLHAHSRVPA
jgi:hypothetical protein